MRRAYQDIGWLLDESDGLAGIALGYDRCAEHEWGVAPLLNAFGVALPEFPLGVEDRMVRDIPQERLTLTEYKHQPRDKRRKAYPAAFLMLQPNHWRYVDERPVGADQLKGLECSFFGEPGDKHWRPQDDLATAWNSSSFCILVRGTENIARLKQLYEAFLAKDIAVALPWAKVFERGGLSFTIPSRMAAADKSAVLERDQAHKKLCEAARATGIYEVLEAAGKRGSLSPDWFDREAEDEVIFFLNPYDQRTSTYGWFTVDELTLWAQGKGPVVLDPALEALKKSPEHLDWSYRLVKGLGEKGVHLRYGPHLTWLDDTKTALGIRIRLAKDSTTAMADGVYPYEAFMAEHAVAPAPAAA